MANFVYIAKSLDGFIATEDGGMDWLSDIPNPEGSDFGFSEFMAKVDAILMGRITFEQVLSFGVWPYEKPVYVLSTKLSGVPGDLEGKAHIISGELEEVIGELVEKGIKNLYIDGGQVIQSFLKADKIDEIILTTVPVLLGSGIPLFKDTGGLKKFRHLETAILNNSLVKSHYVRE